MYTCFAIAMYIDYCKASDCATADCNQVTDWPGRAENTLLCHVQV